LLGAEEASPLPTALPKATKQNMSMIDTLVIPEYRQAVIAVIMIMIAQQLTGINSIIMYGVNLLASLLESNSAILNLGVSLLNIIVTIVCAPLVDKLGRKTCLLVSICGMGISSIFLAIGIRDSISMLSAIAVLFFVGSFGFGLGPIPFILASELVGPEAVNATQSWALGANWISTFIVAQFFPIVNDMLGDGIIYFVFAGLAAFFATFVLFYVPESRVSLSRLFLSNANHFQGKKSADEVWGRVAERID
jgi:MFS family permease